MLLEVFMMVVVLWVTVAVWMTFYVEMIDAMEVSQEHFVVQTLLHWHYVYVGK